MVSKKDKDPNRVKAGKRSKAKGASFELKIAKLLETWWKQISPECRFRRTPGSGGWARAAENMDSFNSAGDIVTGDKSFPFAVELKHHRDWYVDDLINGNKAVIADWWTQAVDQCPAHFKPLLIIKANNRKELVVFDYNKFPNHKITCADLTIGMRRFWFIDPEKDTTLIIVSLKDFLTIPPESISLEASDGAL